MKVIAHCVLGSQVWDLTIPCGEGYKSFKWLGLTAATRFAATVPHGVRRRREAVQSMQGNARLLPINVTKGRPGDESPFLHPDALLPDFLEEGDEVTVILGREIPVNDAGIPDSTRWATVAFTVSESQSYRRQKALQEEERISEEKEEAKKEAERLRRAKEEVRKANTMREVMRSKLQDKHEVACAFHEDWHNLLQNQTLEKLCRDPMVLQHLCHTFREAYLDLSEVFKTYGASASGVGTAHEVEFMEFSAFVHDIKVFATQHGHLSEVITAIFTAATPHQDYMERHSFFVGIILVAWLKYIDGGNGDHTLSRKIPRGEKEEDADPDLPLHLAVRKLIESCINPLIKESMYGSVVKNAINTDQVLAMFFDHMEALHEQFLNAAAPNARAPPGEHNANITISLSEFGSLIERSGLIGSSKKGNTADELTHREVRQAFASAQGETGDTFSTSHLQRMDFPEFVEAIARVGCLKWESSDTPVQEKIQGACFAVCGARG